MFFKIIFQNSIDKPFGMCYSIDAVKKGENKMLFPIRNSKGEIIAYVCEKEDDLVPYEEEEEEDVYLCELESLGKNWW